MRSIPYRTVDVFTAERFGGNPLAVIPDDAGLTTDEMQAIAKEFNYSETTFVGPPDDPANSARVRIFAPTGELPFAGHPNVGTAWVLGQTARFAGAQVLRFEEKAGLVQVRLLREAGEVTGATIRAPGALEIGPELDRDLIAACAGLSPADVAMERHPPIQASVGLKFAFAELTSVEALGRVRPNTAAFAEAEARYGRGDDLFALFLYAREESAGALRARMFAPPLAEDPATGSASAALGAFLASLDPRADGQIDHLIHQGVEMGRPSRIEVFATKAGGRVTGVEISGRCVPVMEGKLSL